MKMTESVRDAARRIDNVVLEGGSTARICRLLREQDDHLNGVLANMAYAHWIFQLDFHDACSVMDRDYLMSISERAPRYLDKMFCRQLRVARYYRPKPTLYSNTCRRTVYIPEEPCVDRSRREFHKIMVGSATLGEKAQHIAWLPGFEQDELLHSIWKYRIFRSDFYRVAPDMLRRLIRKACMLAEDGIVIPFSEDVLRVPDVPKDERLAIWCGALDRKNDSCRRDEQYRGNYPDWMIDAAIDDNPALFDVQRVLRAEPISPLMLTYLTERSKGHIMAYYVRNHPAEIRKAVDWARLVDHCCSSMRPEDAEIVLRAIECVAPGSVRAANEADEESLFARAARSPARIFCDYGDFRKGREPFTQAFRSLVETLKALGSDPGREDAHGVCWNDVEDSMRKWRAVHRR